MARHTEPSSGLLETTAHLAAVARRQMCLAKSRPGTRFIERFRAGLAQLDRSHSPNSVQHRLLGLPIAKQAGSSRGHLVGLQPVSQVSPIERTLSPVRAGSPGKGRPDLLRPHSLASGPRRGLTILSPFLPGDLAGTGDPLAHLAGAHFMTQSLEDGQGPVPGLRGIVRTVVQQVNVA